MGFYKTENCIEAWPIKSKACIGWDAFTKQLIVFLKVENVDYERELFRPSPPPPFPLTRPCGDGSAGKRPRFKVQSH